MPQEFQCLKCHQCHTYQAKQVTKSPKWSCAICGTKQAIQHVFAISGSAKDIRLHVQKLNMAKGQKEVRQQELAQAAYESGEGDLGAGQHTWSRDDTEYADAPAAHQWNSCFDEPETEDHEEPAVYDDEPGFVTSLPEKRARGGGQRQANKRSRNPTAGPSRVQQDADEHQDQGGYQGWHPRGPAPQAARPQHGAQPRWPSVPTTSRFHESSAPGHQWQPSHVQHSKGQGHQVQQGYQAQKPHWGAPAGWQGPSAPVTQSRNVSAPHSSSWSPRAALSHHQPSQHHTQQQPQPVGVQRQYNEQAGQGWGTGNGSSSQPAPNERTQQQQQQKASWSRWGNAGNDTNGAPSRWGGGHMGPGYDDECDDLPDDPCFVTAL